MEPIDLRERSDWQIHRIKDLREVKRLRDAEMMQIFNFKDLPTKANMRFVGNENQVWLDLAGAEDQDQHP